MQNSHSLLLSSFFKVFKNGGQFFNWKKGEANEQKFFFQILASPDAQEVMSVCLSVGPIYRVIQRDCYK